MKTRIIRTGIYKDETMLSLTPDVRFISVYLYTNNHISLTDIYKIPIQLIQLETGYDISTIRLAIDQLSIAKVVHHHNYLWIRLLRSDFASLEYGGEKNDIAIEKYLSEIPLEVKTFLYSDTTMYTTMHSSDKSEIRNQKSEIRNQKKRNDVKFDIFWSAYPKKESKIKARAKWESKKLDSEIKKIIIFIEKAKETDRWKNNYIKDPTTFLHNECWNDDLEGYNDRKNNTPLLIDFTQPQNV